jgi:phage terminase small subunit
MIPVHELDDETAAAIASVEVREEFEGQGEGRKLVGYTKKIRFWDKPAAINMAMKHLGLFERDNSQRRENLAIQVVLVDAEQPAAVQATLVDGKAQP